jgi:hypothetical protein
MTVWKTRSEKMKLYEFVSTLKLSDEFFDTYYLLVVAKDREEALKKFNNYTNGMKVLENSIECEEITEIDGHKIIVED